MQGVFKIALKDRYSDFDPNSNLKDEFISLKRFQNRHNIDTRYSALTCTKDLANFIQDLKNGKTN